MKRKLTGFRAPVTFTGAIPTIDLNDAPKQTTVPSEPEGGAEIEIDVARRASR